MMLQYNAGINESRLVFFVVQNEDEEKKDDEEEDEDIENMEEEEDDSQDDYALVYINFTFFFLLDKRCYFLSYSKRGNKLF